MFHCIRRSLLIVLIVALFPFCIEVPTVLATAPVYEREIQFLKSVGILGYDFSADLSVTRADMARYAISLLHPDLDFTVPSEEESVFRDIKIDHPYYGQIKAAKMFGILNGDAMNRIRPDEAVSMIDAITILINSLGYTPYAQAYGGYPSGFYKVAGESGLIKGVDLTQAGSVTSGQVAKLMYNALFADLNVIESIQTGDITVKVDPRKNILSERLGIKEYDGVVIDDGILSLLGNSSVSDAEKVVIKETGTGNYITAYAGDTNIHSYFGSRLKVFIKLNDHTGRNEVVFFSLHSKAKEVTILSSQILSVEENRITYEKTKDSNSFLNIPISISETYVFYNGKHMVDYDASIFRPQDGLIKCIDNDSNGVYETVIITSFNYRNNSYNMPAYNIVVDSIESEEGLIYCRFNSANNLSLKDPESNYRFIYNDSVKSLSDLKQNMILSVAQCPDFIDGKPFFFLVVSETKKQGMIDSYSEDGFTLNGEFYELSTSILSIKPSFSSRLALQSATEILLDGMGRVAYVEGSSSSKNYGYMIKAGTQKGADTKVMLKMVTKNSEFLTVELSSKAMIDGKVITGATDYELAENQLKALSKELSGYEKFERPPSSKMPEDHDLYSRPILYQLDAQGRILKIDTDTPNTIVEEGTSTKLSDQTPLLYSDEEVENAEALKAGFRSPRTNRYRPNNRSIEGKFMMTTDTVILHVPTIDLWGLESFKTPGVNVFNNQGNLTFHYDIVKSMENEDSPEQYYLMRVSELSSLYQYDIQAYDVDPDTGIADFVVVRGATNVYYNGAVPTSAITYPMCVFLKSTQVYDPVLEKTVVKLYYTRYGEEEITALADLDSMLFYYRYLINGTDQAGNMYNGKEVSPISRGDLIRVFKSAEGYVTHIERGSKLSKIKENYASTTYPSIPRYAYQQTVYSGTGGPDFIPFDVRQYDGTGLLYTVMPKVLKGNYLTYYCGFPFYSTIDLGNKSSYTELHVEMGLAPIVVIEKNETSQDIKIRPGTSTDIKTYQTMGSKEKTSILVLKMNAFKVEQIFVFNGF